MCQVLLRLVCGSLKMVFVRERRMILLSPAFLPSAIFVLCHTWDIFVLSGVLPSKTNSLDPLQSWPFSHRAHPRGCDQEFPKSTEQTHLCSCSGQGGQLATALCFGADFNTFAYNL